MRLLTALFLILLLCGSALGQNYTMYTFAGGGMPSTLTSAKSAPFLPTAVATDFANNVYFISGQAVFVMDSAGNLARLAGSEGAGPLGDGGSSVAAHLNEPMGIALDPSGVLYIADSFNHRIRKVAMGVITTVAGNGTAGYSGDGGQATSAQLNTPYGIAVDATGNLYIADTLNQCIRKVTPAGVISTVAGGGTVIVSSGGVPATSAQLYEPRAVAVDSTGNLYVEDTSYYGTLLKVSNTVITTVFDWGTLGEGWYMPGGGFAVDKAGDLFIADGLDGVVFKLTPGGALSTVAGGGANAPNGVPATSASLADTQGVALDSTGNLYITAENINGCYVYKVNTSGIISEMAGDGTYYGGDGGPATSADMNDPESVAADGAGNVYVADNLNNRIREVTPDGTISTVAGNGGSGYWGDGGPATGANLNRPEGVAMDGAGNLYIADSDNFVIRKVSKGIISTVAGNGTQGYSGDGGPATSAQLNDPTAIAVDSTGNLYIADLYAHVIRKVSKSDGTISTIAGNGSNGVPCSSGDGGPATSARFCGPSGVAVDLAGNVYIADEAASVIRKVSSGVISTFAGTGNQGFAGDNGPAISAHLCNPSGVAVDTFGNVYIADTYNSSIRVVSNGTITTIAGNGTGCNTGLGNGYSGDGGFAANAEIDSPMGVAVDTAGNVYIADTGNNMVRVMVPVLTLQAASLSSTSGTISLGVDAGASLKWTTTSNDSWITVTGGASGTGNGTVRLSVQANSTGNARTGTVTIAGQTFTIQQESNSTTGFNVAGSMAHLASAGGWDTSLTLVNLDTSASEARLNFYNDSGSVPLLPFTFPQQLYLGTTLASTFDQSLNPGAMSVLDTTGSSETPVTGWAELVTTGNIDGFAVFKDTSTNQEAVVPMESRNAGSYVLAFDNTGQLATGVAIANLSEAAKVNVIICDDTGAQIGTGSIALPTMGHTSFMLTDPQKGFPATANMRGTIEFDTPQNGEISVLGLRANGSALTTLPLLAEVGTSGGNMPHVASGGGWQTTFTLVNTGTSAANATLSFQDDSGNALALPLSFPQTESTATESSVSQSIPAGATLLIVTAGDSTAAVATGSAQLTTDGNVSGFAIFQEAVGQMPAGTLSIPLLQEAVVPLETGTANSYILAFDNTDNLATGIALANSATQPAAIPVTLWDDTGASIGTTTINVPASGHLSEMLTGLFPAAANIRGTVEFDTPSGGQIAALGIRATSAGAFTTIPVMTK